MWGSGNNYPKGSAANLLHDSSSVQRSHSISRLCYLLCSSFLFLPFFYPSRARGVVDRTLIETKYVPLHLLDGLMSVLQVSATRRAPLTRNASVTLTHICRGAQTHSIIAGHTRPPARPLALSRSPWMSRHRLGEDKQKKSCDLPLICSLASAWASVPTATSRTLPLRWRSRGWGGGVG